MFKTVYNTCQMYSKYHVIFFFDSSIRSFTTLKPEGMEASGVRLIPETDNEFYCLLTWKPTTNQIGKHPVCFQAIDNFK